MKLKRVHNLLIAITLTCAMAATPVFAAPSLQDQKSAAQSEVSSLQTQLTDLMSKMTDLQNQLISKGEEITKAEQQLSEAEAKKEQQYQDMLLRIKYMYEEGDGTAVERILTSGSIAEMLSQSEYVQKIHTYDRDQLTEYAETVTEVEDLKAGLEDDMSKMETMQTEYEDQQTTLSDTIDSKSAEVANLDQQIQAAAAEAARKAAEEAAAAAKKAEEEAAKNAAAQNNSQTTNNTNTNTNTNTPSAGGGTSTPEAVTPAPETPSVQPDTNTGGNSNTSQGNTSAAQTIVNAAWSQIGVPYVWGGTTPYVGLDCSGLTQWCHAQAGISIGRVDSDQLAGGQIVSDPQPGDICWTPGHVAIYIGGGQMIEAQQTGVPICVSSVRATYYVRYW